MQTQTRQQKLTVSLSTEVIQRAKILAAKRCCYALPLSNRGRKSFSLKT